MGENVVFLEKNILQNGTCRVNVYLHSCLSHKSILINFVIIEDCRDLHISGIQVDRSRENFIARIETHAFVQNTKRHIVLYGPLTATNTEADAKLAQRPAGRNNGCARKQRRYIHILESRYIHIFAFRQWRRRGLHIS